MSARPHPFANPATETPPSIRFQLSHPRTATKFAAAVSVSESPRPLLDSHKRSRTSHGGTSTQLMIQSASESQPSAQRGLRRSASSGSSLFRQARKVATISFRGQRAPDVAPKYGRKDMVEGSVAVHIPDGITCIEITLEGRIRTGEVAGVTSATTKIVSQQIGYWSEADGSCPRSVAFQTVLPTSFTDCDGTRQPWPPSFRQTLKNVPGFSVSVAYFVRATIHRARDFSSLWRKATKMDAEFLYLPKTRPPSPAHSVRDPSSSRSMIIRSSIPSDHPILKPVDVELHLPPTPIFCMSRPIPFHVRLSSASRSSIDLFSEYAPRPQSFLPLYSELTDSGHSSGSSLPIKSALSAYTLFRTHSNTNNAAPSSATSRPLIALHIHRSVAVAATNSNVVVSSTRNTFSKVTVIGHSSDLFRAGSGDRWIEFSGWIHPELGMNCGGFATNRLRVQDYLVFTIAPPNASRSPLGSVYKSLPCILTTDPYESSGATKVTGIKL